jgi:hypothetical protein
MSPVALVLGIVGLMQINQRPTELKGTPIAIAGILLGFFGVASASISWSRVMDSVGKIFGH